MLATQPALRDQSQTGTETTPLSAEAWCDSIKYLIRNFSSDLVEGYVLYSFRHERKLHDQIAKNIEARKGIIFPIEDRMLRSIERSAMAAEIQIDSSDGDDKIAVWRSKNLFERAEELGLDDVYLAAVGGGSHSVHGNWYDLYSHHLAYDERTKRFSPDLTWTRPRPQLLTSLTLITIRAVDHYFQFMTAAEIAADVRKRLQDLESRVNVFVQGHEAYLGGKNWPQT